MSIEPAANPPATPAAVAPVAPPPTDSRLPEGVVVKGNYSQDIDKYFDGPEGAVVVAGKPPVEGANQPPAAPPAAAPAPNSVAGKLAAKLPGAAPVVPVVPAAAPADATNDAIAKVEAEMVKHNPKWKPAEGWTVLKTTLRSESDARAKLEKEVADLKIKVAAPVVAGVTAQEIEELKAREKAASDRLMVMDLENHPAFKSQFVDPKNAEIARATELLLVHGVKVDVAALIAKPRAELGKAVAEAIKDVPEFDRVEVAEAIRKAHTLEQGGREALGKSKELGQSLQQQSVQRQRDAFAKRWAPVSAAIGEFAQPVETPADATPEQRAADTAYNAELAALRTKAEAIALAPISEEAVAESAIKAAAYDLHIGQVMPRVLSEYQSLVTLNQQLTAELTAIRGRNPNHGIRPPTGGGGGEPSNDPSKMDHASAADHFFNRNS